MTSSLFVAGMKGDILFGSIIALGVMGRGGGVGREGRKGRIGPETENSKDLVG